MSKKGYIVFLFLIINGTWVWIAYLCYMAGVEHKVIAIVVPIGLLLANLAAYAGVKIAERLLRSTGPKISN